jgi:hypothetical protein
MPKKTFGFKPVHPEFLIALVEFKGNHLKQYEFFVEREMNLKDKDIDALNPHVGDAALCSTSNGLSVGKIVDLKPFSKRSDKCSAMIIAHYGLETTAYEKQMLEAVKYQEDQELNDILDL